jgi:hypothetical protein
MNRAFDEAEEQEAGGRGEHAVFFGFALGEFRERLGFDWPVDKESRVADGPG